MGEIAGKDLMQFKLKRVVLAMFLLGLPVLFQPVSAAVNASQSTVIKNFNIPAGALDKTLLDIARIGGKMISFNEQWVKNLRSPAVKGHFTVEQAINQALSSSNLVVDITDNGTLTVRQKTAAAKAITADNNSSAAALPAITVSSNSDRNQNADFTNETSSTALRGNTYLSETPQSVTVVNSAVADQQQSKDMTDMLRNVSGVDIGANQNGASTFSLRGYSDVSTSVDGLNDNDSGDVVAGIDSIEVLKGPSAIVSGTATPGGTVNIVKKKPTDQTIHHLQLGYGSGKDRLASLDLGGALSADKRLRYRMIFSGEKASDFNGDPGSKKQYYFAPSIGWKDDTTNAIVGAEFTDEHLPQVKYAGALDGIDSTSGRAYAITPRPIAVPNIDTQNGGINERVSREYYSWEQQLTHSLSFTSKSEYNHSFEQTDEYLPGFYIAGIRVNGAETLLNPIVSPVSAYNSIYINDALLTDNYLTLKVNTGPVKHTLIGGYNYMYNRYKAGESGNSYLYNYNTGVFTDDSTGSTYTESTLPSLNDLDAPNLTNTEASRQWGGYLQDQMKYNKWTAVMSMRYSVYAVANVANTDVSNNADYSYEHAWTPNLGVLYQLTDDVGVYANYLRGFIPNTFAKTSSGSLLPTEQTSQYEVGVKSQLLDDRLTVTNSLFDIITNNAAMVDPNNPEYDISAGGQASRGFETDVQGSFYPGLNIIASYTYTDSYNPEQPQDEVMGVSKQKGSLWGSYQFQSGRLAGYWLGAGLYANSYSYGTFDGSLKIPGGTRTDLSAGYKAKTWSVTLGVKNVFNRTLYGTSDNGFGVGIPVYGRTAMLSSDIDF